MESCNTCLKKDKCTEAVKKMRATTARMLEISDGDLSILGEIRLLGQQIEDYKKIGGHNEFDNE